MESPPPINFSDCRVSNFRVWHPMTIGNCFFRLCLQLPVFGILTIGSAYYTGRRSVNYILFTSWNKYQSAIIYIRAFIVSFLAILPIVSLSVRYGLETDPIGFTEIVLIFVKTFAWLIHLCYTLQLKRGISYNCRGPKPIIVIWFGTAIISALDFRRYYVDNHFKPLKLQTIVEDDMLESTSIDLYEIKLWFSGVEALLQFIYMLSLIPGSVHLEQRHYRSLLTDSPTEPHTVHNQNFGSYIGFHEDDGPMYLGIAKENASSLSKLLFWWVNRLMRKGSCGYLAQTEDLFDLPPKMSTSYVATNFQNSILSCKSSLMMSLFKSFGTQFFSIGILKLIADGCGFCGPIFLNLLISFIEEDNREGQSVTGNDVGRGYLYVFGMVSSALIGMHKKF